jgi:type IV fimbrial biogenesis protein FimT
MHHDRGTRAARRLVPWAMQPDRGRARDARAARGRDETGLTLIELLAALAVTAIVLSLAVPAMTSFFDAKRLIGAAEQVYGHLQQARMESIARSATVVANFDVDGSMSWAYGLSHRDLCDPSQTTATGANACVLVVDDGDGIIDPGTGVVDIGDLMLMRFDDAEHLNVSMDIDSFSSGNTEVRFDPIRGTATSGKVLLTSGEGRRLNVMIGLLGRIRICSPDGSVNGYSTAGC